MFIYTAFISIRVYQLYVWMLNLVLSSLTANYLLGSYQVGNNRKTDCRNVDVWPGPVTFFRGDWSFIFLQPLSPFRWFKKGSRHFLAKECAQVLGNQETCGLIIWPARSDLNGVDRAVKPQNQPNQPMVRSHVILQCFFLEVNYFFIVCWTSTSKVPLNILPENIVF